MTNNMPMSPDMQSNKPGSPYYPPYSKRMDESIRGKSCTITIITLINGRECVICYYFSGARDCFPYGLSNNLTFGKLVLNKADLT